MKIFMYESFWLAFFILGTKQWVQLKRTCCVCSRNGVCTSSTVLLGAVRLWTWRLHGRISSRLLLIAAVLLLPAKLLLLLLLVLLQLLLLHPVVVHLLLQASKQPVPAYDEI